MMVLISRIKRLYEPMPARYHHKMGDKPLVSGTAKLYKSNTIGLILDSIFHNRDIMTMVLAIPIDLLLLA